MDWHENTVELPKDGSICDIVLSESDKGIVLICAVVENGKLMLNGNDVTSEVIKWHKIPDIVYKNNRIMWDDKLNTD